VAEAYLEGRSGLSVYSDLALGAPAEPYRIYSVGLDTWTEEHSFRHSVRPAIRSDLPRIHRVLRGVYGYADERWFATSPPESERWLVVELDGELAGVGCASLAGRHGRLHSLSVRPRCRNLGVGADLVFARLLWLRAAGASAALSEISDRNLPSQALAERAGMRVVGRLFRYERARAPPVPPT
jgi:RimJ/RimL family protein N-acetyltransferase